VTAIQLLTWICVALGLQLAVGIAVATRQRRGMAPPQPQGGDVDGALATSGAWLGWRKFRIARREFEDTSRSQCSFYLAPADGALLPPFRPGQFLTFSLPIADRDVTMPDSPRTLTRCYSLSERPLPTHYRITVKRVPAPADQAQWPPGISSSLFHDHLHEGDVLDVKAPAGHFCIDPDPATPVVLVAGGIGITPLMSMLRWSLDEQPERAVHLYYGLRNGGEHAFKQQLEQLARTHPNFHLTVVYSRPGPHDARGRDFQQVGHIDIDLLRRSLPHGRHQFYVCGPAPMMAALVPGLAQWGVPPQGIHHEAFGPAAVRSAGLTLPAAASGHGSTPAIEVQFRRTGRTLNWDGQDPNLLDFAERHGVAVASGCRAGSCGSCETELVSGRVGYASTPDHDIAPGHCLLCIGVPQTPLILEA
jgi:uncharacterized protein